MKNLHAKIIEMAFDLYVGPASRYQSGDWKTVGQQMAEEQGLAFNVIRPKPSFLGSLFKPKPAKAYQTWRDAIQDAYTKFGDTDPLWNDSPDQEYVTDRPGWEGHNGLLLRYAYLLHPELTACSRVPRDSEMEADPAMRAMGNEKFDRFHALMHCSMFIPGKIDRPFVAREFNGIQIAMTSLTWLNAALWQICDLWGKERALMGAMATDPPDADASIDDAAIHGLAVYCRLTDEAINRNLPLIKDY